MIRDSKWSCEGNVGGIIKSAGGKGGGIVRATGEAIVRVLGEGVVRAAGEK